MPSTTVRCAPSEANPSHHLRLRGKYQGKIYDIGLITCDGSGRPDPYAIVRDRLSTTSLKISQGNPKYSDMELPFTPMPQDNWHGGRGNEMYEDDTTAYLDSKMVNTMFDNKFFLQGQPQVGTGYRNIELYDAQSVFWQPLTPGSRRFLAHKFTAGASFTADKIGIPIKRSGSPGTMTIELCADNTGDPGSVLKTKTLLAADVTDILGIWQYFSSIAQAVSISTDYWVKVYGAATDNDVNHWKVAVDVAAGSAKTKQSSDGTSWSASGIDLYFVVKEADDDPDRVYPFSYRGGQYALLDYDDANPIILLNGDRGAADDNSGNKALLNDATKSWTVDEFKDCVALVIGGPGSTEAQPWRNITGNGGTYLTCSPAWKITHTTATEYVILGAKKWRQVFTSVMGTNDITDVCVVDDRIYLARGQDVVIRAIRAYNNSGTWTEQSADEASNKADKLGVVSHRETNLNKRQIWRALNDTVEVSRGDIPVWDTDITFGTGIPVGDDEDPIVKLVEHIDPDYGNKILWVMKRNGPPWAVKLDVPEMVTLPEMRTLASIRNCKAVIIHDTYLYFSLMKGGVERFYAGILDDVGPNRGRGLPENRLGTLEQFEGYPGEFYAAMNAGATGYSSILAYDGTWHDTYQADEMGQEIKAMIYQVVPGDKLDWLWFLEGSTFKRIPFPSETIYPYYDTNFRYNHEGVLGTSRMYANMVDVNKLFDNLKIIADSLAEDVCWIEVDYKVDSETAAWLPFPIKFDTSPSQQVNLVNEGDECVTGKFLMLRYRLQTSDNSKTPMVRATLVESISRIPTKFGYTATVRFETHPTDLNTKPDDYYENGLQKITDLDTLAESLTVLDMSSIHSPFDEVRVFVEAPSIRPMYRSTGEQLEGFVGTLAITQVLKAEEGIE